MDFELTTPKDWEAFTEHLANLDDRKGYRVTITRIRDSRTDQQRKAIELYCKMMAEALNDAGYEYKDFIASLAERGVEVPWTQERFKEVWRRFQTAMTGKVSTTKLSSAEVSQVYEVVNRKMAELSGVSMNFPDRRG